MREEGVTLTEVMVVVGIIAILVIVFGFSYQGWMGKYRVESQIKEIYADLMDTRSRAVTRNHWYFVSLNTNEYLVTEDTNDSLGTAPDDGDDIIIFIFDPDDPEKKIPKPLDRYYQLTMVSGGTLPLMLIIDTRGLLSYVSENSILPVTTPIVTRINSSSEPDYDCLIIDRSRIRMGQYNGTTCKEK